MFNNNFDTYTTLYVYTCYLLPYVWINFLGNVPSPGSSVPSLNTPMNPSSNAGPSPLAQEDIAYREKVRQLSKYIEPLRKMIAHMGNEGKIMFLSFYPYINCCY